MMGRLNHEQRRLIPPASSRFQDAFGRLSLQAGDDEAFAPRSVPLTANANRNLRTLLAEHFLFSPRLSISSPLDVLSRLSLRRLLASNVTPAAG